MVNEIPSNSRGGAIRLQAGGTIATGQINAAGAGSDSNTIGPIAVTPNNNPVNNLPNNNPANLPTPNLFEPPTVPNNNSSLPENTPPLDSFLTPNPLFTADNPVSPNSNFNAADNLSNVNQQTDINPQINNGFVTGDRPEISTNINSIAPPSISAVESSIELSRSLDCVPTNVSLPAIEEGYTKEFEEYLGSTANKPAATLSDTCETLGRIAALTDSKPAVIYAKFVPTKAKSKSNDRLEIILVTARGQFITRRPFGATRSNVAAAVKDFTDGIEDIEKVEFESLSYLPAAQKLYQWLIEPLAAELQAEKIDNISFILDEKLRSIPLAALHSGTDGNNPQSGKFLVEKYAIALMPSLTLTDIRYTDIRNAKVLAMGASEFAPDQRQTPLPFVPLELSAIPREPWKPAAFLNESFTLNNLEMQRRSQPFGIIHLATHAQFKSGPPENSFIQLWNDKLPLTEVQNLSWNNPPVTLLVLSACQTARGDRDAELGFAGLAFKAGVKSVLGSLWYVRGEGTLPLMAEFYHQLTRGKIKVESLRSAQMAMLQGKVKIDSEGLISIDNESRMLSSGQPLKIDLELSGNINLSHPYYWSGFTMIGSPW
ncbi:MAG: CHAT domain-containing protein [Oscillatoriales cyanobacterium RU_3_3]|nr:CHAT domain-containing protein [Oscillatoriales cyanobacterium RU_3_3]